MKKLLPFLLLPLLFAACSGNEPSPVIEVAGVFVNDDETNYAKEIDKMPALNVGDEVDLTLLLNGSGADLKTFQLSSDTEVKTELVYQDADVSKELDFTDVEKGRLRFVDGVESTELTVKAIVRTITKEDSKLVFYLSSKAECDGAQCEVSLKTGKQD